MNSATPNTVHWFLKSLCFVYLANTLGEYKASAESIPSVCAHPLPRSLEDSTLQRLAAYPLLSCSKTLYGHGEQTRRVRGTTSGRPRRPWRAVTMKRRGWLSALACSWTREPGKAALSLQQKTTRSPVLAPPMGLVVPRRAGVRPSNRLLDMGPCIRLLWAALDSCSFARLRCTSKDLNQSAAKTGHLVLAHWREAMPPTWSSVTFPIKGIQWHGDVSQTRNLGMVVPRLESCSTLVELRIQCIHPVDLAWITELHSLRTLRVSSWHMTTLSNVGALTALQYLVTLHLSRVRLLDLPVQWPRTLRHLSVRANDQAPFTDTAIQRLAVSLLYSLDLAIRGPLTRAQLPLLGPGHVHSLKVRIDCSGTLSNLVPWQLTELDVTCHLGFPGPELLNASLHHLRLDLTLLRGYTSHLPETCPLALETLILDDDSYYSLGTPTFLSWLSQGAHQSKLTGLDLCCPAWMVSPSEVIGRFSRLQRLQVRDYTLFKTMVLPWLPSLLDLSLWTDKQKTMSRYLDQLPLFADSLRALRIEVVPGLAGLSGHTVAALPFLHRLTLVEAGPLPCTFLDEVFGADSKDREARGPAVPALRLLRVPADVDFSGDQWPAIAALRNITVSTLDVSWSVRGPDVPLD